MGREQLREPEESMLEHEETTQQAQAQASDAPASLIQQATAILLQPDPQSKAHQTHDVAELWRQEQLPAGNTGSVQLPDRPGRDDNKVKVVAPGKVPGLGKGGSLASRQAILHSLVHIESWAVDLSWDAVARFGRDPQYALPSGFLDDFVQVANDEASHFQQLQQRLEAIGSFYGALPVHDGLWESAAATAHSLPARLAVESCVHEARGLDRLPHTIQRFRNSGDTESALLLERIYQEEISHCAAGVRWLTYLHSQALAAKQRQDLPITHQLQQATLADLNLSSQPSSTSIRPVPTAAGAVDTTAPSSEAGLASTQNGKAAPSAAAAQANATPAPCSGGSHHLDPVSQSETNGKVSRSASSNDGDVALLDWQTDAQQYATVEKWFHALVRAHFKGSLKPPFNEAARAAAGFGPEWYLPLSSEVLR